MHKIKTDQFEGPLDLLLQLIEQQKMDISEISLSKVTEQYLECLKESENKISLDELADFLVIAAKLLLLKSRTLLPYLQVDEEDDASELEQQLKIYKQFYDASKIIQQQISEKNFCYSRQNLLAKNTIAFCPPANLSVKKLALAFERFLSKIAPIIKLPKSFIKKSINISEKIKQLKEKILSQANSSFHSLLNNSKDRSELIVSFLALLELVKQKIIAVEQKNFFDDIKIKRIEK